MHTRKVLLYRMRTQIQMGVVWVMVMNTCMHEWNDNEVEGFSERE